MDKTHILQEIRRTAAENGGKPLGWRRFESETGIKQYEWLGKHWARWGDAIIEAGLKPNQLTSARHNDDLFDTYACLAEKLRRLPTSSDLRLAARSGSSVPSDKTFGRLGTKLQFVGQLLEFCRTRKEHAGVVPLCEEYLSRKPDLSGDSPSPGEVIGFVYLLKSSRFYKIGRTNDAGRREYELAIQLPERAKRVHVIRTDDPGGIEAYWHKRFESKRRNGEWFELDATDVTAFKRRKFM